MPLLDHFRPPLSLRRHWHAFHSAWATYLAAQLNERLPEGYFAEPTVPFNIEIDVATFEETAAVKPGPAAWTGPAQTLTIPLPVLTDVVEVLVYDRESGPILAGAIQLASPANKDRPEHRDAFVSKCAAYLQQGVGLVIVDVVTGRRVRLHDELLGRLGAPGRATLDGELYATAYRTVERDNEPRLDIWEEPLAVGNPLPILPLWLRGNLCLSVDLDAAYRRTCAEHRISA